MRYFQSMILVLFFVFPCASAQSREAWAAPWDAYFLPLGTAPLSSGCAIEPSFRMVNYLSYNTGAWGEINTDVEIWTLRLGVRYATEIGEFSVSIPVHLAWGGILDVPLNAFHRLIGVGSSPEPALSEIRYFLATGERKTVSGTRFGIGDAMVSWAYNLEPFWTRLTVGIPTGDASQFFGAGGWRVQISAGIEQRLFGIGLGVLVPLGKIEALEVFKPQISLQIRAWWQIPSVPVQLELHATTSPVQIGGQFAATVIAIRFVWQTNAGQFSFSEDFMPTLPDVVLAWDGRFTC